MGIVLGEGTYAHQSVERAVEFVAVNVAQFAHAKRKFTVAVIAGLVDEHSARAVHRLDGVFVAVDFREVHVFFIVVPVAGAVPQIRVEDHRGLDFLVARLRVFFAPEVFELVADNHSLGMEERETRSFFVHREQVQFLAELSVVALLRFFEACQVFVKLRFFREGCSVYALEHLVVRVRVPVGACQACQLECLDLRRTHDVRSRTQVCPFALAVE